MDDITKSEIQQESIRLTRTRLPLCHGNLHRCASGINPPWLQTPWLLKSLHTAVQLKGVDHVDRYKYGNCPNFWSILWSQEKQAKWSWHQFLLKALKADYDNDDDDGDGDGNDDRSFIVYINNNNNNNIIIIIIITTIIIYYYINNNNNNI